MIPVNEPLLGKKELKNVSDCITSGWISSKGKYINLFEEKFAEYCGTKYGVSVTNGTTAIHLALASLGIQKGDEVILPTFTMIATLYAVLYTGAKPVFVDSEPRTWNMDVAGIKDKITPRTRAVLPVHIYGHPVDMTPLRRLAKARGLFVVEDAAEAHGAEYRGKRCGSLSDIACFSFYANKIITTGEGGMVVTSNKKLAERARLLKDLAHSPGKRFLHVDLAYNYRMTNMQAAVGLAQLEQIDKFLRIKRHMARTYETHLKDIEGIRLPMEEEWAKNVYWMYAILIEDSFGMGRDELMKELRNEGVDTRAFFVPMHEQPVVKDMGILTGKDRYPVADEIAGKGLYLPSGLAITDEQMDFVCRKIKKIRGKCASRRRKR